VEFTGYLTWLAEANVRMFIHTHTKLLPAFWFSSPTYLFCSLLGRFLDHWGSFNHCLSAAEE